MESLVSFSKLGLVLLLSRWNLHPKLEIPESTLDFVFVLDCVEHLKYNTMPKA